MNFLTSFSGILVMLAGFGGLIFVHEMGHFIAAKWAGIRTEAFAVGMGPVAVSWRKGVGITLGSTDKKVLAAAGKMPGDLGEAELAAHGLGETEYSLRWLPIGGFVKMLGQEDLKPIEESSDARSYATCAVGKRMIVVSAGVIMNVLLALALFVLAFLAGVRFEAPVVGAVVADLPAGTTTADNADLLGVSEPGLRPGDLVTHIDGDPARTFADIQIASAMGRPGVPIHLTIRRAGLSEPLRFSIVPEVDSVSHLLSIGVGPGSSTTLVAGAERMIELLDRHGLRAAGVEPGMRVLAAAGTEISTYGELDAACEASGGADVPTLWSAVNEAGELVGSPVEAPLAAEPEFLILRYPDLNSDGKTEVEFGLFGLTPLTRVVRVSEDGNSVGVLLPGDVIFSLGDLDGPGRRAIIDEVTARKGQSIPITVLRAGAVVSVTGRVNRKGRLGIELLPAWELPLVARPMVEVSVPGRAGRDRTAARTVATPAARLDLVPRTAVAAVGDVPVRDWATFREALRALTASARAKAAPASIPLTVTPPGAESRVVELVLSAADIEELHEATWHPELPAYAFEPIFTTLSADGSPFRAVAMGFHETRKMIVMTYLTIDRLIRGTVGVEQLRGPVGIVDLGSKILPKGFMFFLFFLGMISVNLAVLNFLPLPIVDGGLFLYLIYEKLKGQPPSVGFQNAATIVGLGLIATIFVVTFYNDIMRLL